MAIRVPFIGQLGKGGRNPDGATPPYSGSAPTQPLDQLVGHTPQEPDPAIVRPRVGAPPIGQSGRANFYGLPEIDEKNPRLAGLTGLRMFDEMYRQDPHIRRLILAAWSPITAGTWTLEPYGGEDATDQDRKIAETVWWMLTKWMTPNLTQHIHTLGPMLLRFGFVPFEQLWAPVKYQGQGATLLGPRKLDVRLPRTIWRWWQDDWGELTYIGQILPNRPDVVIPATDLTYYRLAGEGDNWQGTSLLRHCYKPWFIKDRLERIDMIGQERKAVGVPVVYHTTDINKDVLNDVERAVASMHTSEVAYLMLPGRKMGTAGGQGIAGTEEWLVDIVKFDSSSGSTIKDSIEYHQTSISASFLTDFLELGHHQVGARATAEVQEDPFLTAITGSLLPPVIPVLDELVDRIVKLNWDGAQGSPSMKVTLHDDASLSEISSYVQQLVAGGALLVDEDLEDWLRERAGLPPANQKARAANQQVQDAQRDATLAGAQATADDPQGLKAAAAAAKAAPAAPAGKPAAKPAKPTAKPAAKPAAKPKPAKTLDSSGPVAAGLIVRADDTGRVLLIQRVDDHHDDDDTRARWEFPGGKQDDDDATPYATGVREWQEETGSTLPSSARRFGSFVTPDGKYQAFGLSVPAETDVALGDPDADEVASVAWWDPARLATDHRVRGKVQQALPDIHRLLSASTARTLDVWDAAARLLDAAGEQSTNSSDTVAIDFDGVIHPNTPDSAPLTEGPCVGAVDGVRRVARDWKIVIHTARSDLAGVRAWLKQYGLGAFAATVTHEKPVAVAYVDDRGVHHDGDWDRTIAKIDARVHQLDAPVPISVRDRVRRSTPNLELTGPPGTVTRDHAAEDDGASVYDVAWDDGTHSQDVREYHLRRLDAAVEPTARWFDRLLSQDRLGDAFDSARDHIEAAVGPAALNAARHAAHQAREGAPIGQQDPPAGLVDALTQHYTGMYQLGHETVQAELQRQRAHLGKQLDDPATDTTAGVAATRLARARQRGEHSARNIANRVGEVLGRAQITGLKDGAALQTAAETAATRQLHQEALTNTAASVNDGRYDSAMSSGDVVGGVYTSVMDERSCDPCIASDTGDVLPPDEAISYGPPNPDCQGADYCRCAIVWVLSTDPGAFAQL